MASQRTVEILALTVEIHCIFWLQELSRTKLLLLYRQVHLINYTLHNSTGLLVELANEVEELFAECHRSCKISFSCNYARP